MLLLPLALTLKHERRKLYPNCWQLHGNSQKGTEALLLSAAKLRRLLNQYSSILWLKYHLSLFHIIISLEVAITQCTLRRTLPVKIRNPALSWKETEIFWNQYFSEWDAHRHRIDTPFKNGTLVRKRMNSVNLPSSLKDEGLRKHFSGFVLQALFKAHS